MDAVIRRLPSARDSRAAQAYDGISLVVTPDPSSADQFSAELEFFLAGDANTPLMRFPDWETLPYDAFSPHQDIISDRLRVLVALDSMRRGVLVVPVGTLMGRLPPPEFLARYSLSLKNGDRLDLDNMRQKLTRAGYRAVSQVTEHGEFRGSRVATGFVPNGSGYTDARRFVRR